MEELNIDHSNIIPAVLVGIDQTILEMKLALRGG
jgi:pyridoxine 5'-phosphate synthase PdxJ